MKNKITLEEHLELARWILQAREFIDKEICVVCNAYGRTSPQGAASIRLSNAIGRVATLMDDQMFLDYPGENDGYRYYGQAKRYTFLEFLELHVDDQNDLGEAARAWRDDSNPNKPSDPYKWGEVCDYLTTERAGEGKPAFLIAWRTWERNPISLRRGERFY